MPEVDVFTAIANPARREVLRLLRDGGPHPVAELAQRFDMSRPSLSEHLRLLKDAGLVTEEPRGTQRIYRLHDQGVAAVQHYLTQVWGDAAARLRMFAENTTKDAGEGTP